MSQGANGGDPLRIYFYSHLKNDYGCFSNFSPHGVELDGRWWPTVEHYFQGQKFPGTSHMEAIRQAQSPKTAKTLGRSRQFRLRPDWEAVKDDIMRRAVHRKFESRPEIGAVLLS